MYADYFQLAAEPFGLTPDPAFLYLSPEHREALAAVHDLQDSLEQPVLWVQTHGPR